MDYRPKHKKFIAGIFYDPHNPRYFSFSILKDLTEIPQIDSYEDWHGKVGLTTDEKGEHYIPVELTGWKKVIGPELGAKDNRLSTHLLRHPDRYPKYVYINDFDTWEEAEAAGDYFKDWWENGGWKNGTSDLGAELIENYPDNRIDNPVKDLSTGVIYPSTAEAARAIGTSQGNISRVARGLRKTAGGTAWDYVDLDTGKPTPKEHKPKTSSRVSTMLWLEKVEYDTLTDREKVELFDELYPTEPLDEEPKAWVLAIDQDGKVRPFSGEKLELMLEFIRMANDREFIRQGNEFRGVDNLQVSEDLIDLQLLIGREKYFEAFLRYATLFSRLMGWTPKTVNQEPKPLKIDPEFEAEKMTGDDIANWDTLFYGGEFPYLQEVRDAKGTRKIRGRLENSQNPQKT